MILSTVSKSRALSVTALLILLILTKVANSTEIQFITHNVFGKVFKDNQGKLRGVSHGGQRALQVELILEMMKLVDYESKEIQIMPFIRGLRTVQSEPNVAFFNVSRRPDREGTVKWIGPIQSGIVSFYEATNSPTHITSLADAKRVRAICVVNGNNHDTYLTNLGFTNLSRNNNYENCMKMLTLGRVDLVTLSNFSLQGSLKATNIKNEQVRKTGVPLYETQGYIAMSNNIPDHTILKWQRALDRIKITGKYEELVKEYLY